MRIRSILPNFYRSEDVGKMDWDTRLIFIGLWSYADDNGVGRDVSQLIVADLFPYDDTRETVARLSRGLQALSDGGQIIRYPLDGKPLLFIVKWDLYQRIDKPAKVRYERPEHEGAVIRETVATPSLHPRETVVPGEGEKGRRGEVKDLSSADALDVFDLFWELYPKKEAKGAAAKAFKAASKKIDPNSIILGLKAQLPILVKTERQFVPLAGTWLNAERWADESPVDVYDPTDQWARAYRMNGPKP